jgi:hypothetical protein
MPTWLTAILAEIATSAKVPAEDLAKAIASALLPTLATDLTPIVQKAVDATLAKYPLAVLVEPQVNAAIAGFVQELVTAIEAKLA